MLKLFTSPGTRRNTEFTVVRTRAGRLENALGKKVFRIEALTLREWQIRDIKREIRALTVFTLHITRHKIADKLRPALLGIPGTDRISML